jgi:hypothetical protein
MKKQRTITSEFWGALIDDARYERFVIVTFPRIFEPG